MSRLQSRCSIAGAGLLAILLSSRPAGAQIGVDPGPPREPGGPVNNVLTGAYYDIANQKLAVHHLQHLQAKLRRDAERGDLAAVDFDARCINKIQYRIVIDEWLIRWNMRDYPCFYPIYTDDVSLAAIAQATHPTEVPAALRQVPPPRPTPTGPMISITIVNAVPAGAGVDFAINGIPHRATAGSRQDLAVAADSTISYDGGGSVGQRQYRLAPGVYEFRLTAEGWALYKLADMP